MKEKTVWIVEDDKGLNTLLYEEVSDAGFEAVTMQSGEKAWAELDKDLPDLIVCDLKLPGMDGLEFLRKLTRRYEKNIPGFILITAFATIPTAVEALKAGADDFLTKPLDLEHFMLSVKRVLEKKELKETVNKMRGLLSLENFHGMYGKSAVMHRLFEQIRQVAKAQGPVLILGESGTGKELVAKAVHLESKRSNNPFIPVNCAGIPEHLLESEFFGHAKGAFTGAGQSRQGLFSEAEKGSILLDEISEMPLTLQAKLLRILQDGSLRKIGENREQKLDVRVLAATHRNIEEDVKNNKFREDLFFRLEAFTLKIPPLRERGEDIELLALRFMNQFSLGLNKKIKGFTPEALDYLVSYSFPGNVRELSNIVERAVTFANDNYIKVSDLPGRLLKDKRAGFENCDNRGFKIDESRGILPLEEVEKEYIHYVLKKVEGNKRKAASLLKIGRRTLYRRL
jgi:DNA-binding NtrC family response regulator